MTQNVVTLSSLVTSNLCQNNWTLDESTNKQETRRGCDTQRKILVTNLQKNIRRSNRHIQHIAGNPKIGIQRI